MRTERSIYLVVIAVLAILLTLSTCDNKKPCDDDVIIIPEKEVEFEPKKDPTPLPKKDSIPVKWRDRIIYIHSESEDKVEEHKEKDEDGRFEDYVDAIQVREYREFFQHEHANVEIYSKVEGKLLEVKPTVTIKEQKVPVKVKRDVFYVGGGARLDIAQSKTALQGTAMFKLNNDYLIYGSYGTDKSVSTGLVIPLF